MIDCERSAFRKALGDAAVSDGAAIGAAGAFLKGSNIGIVALAPAAVARGSLLQRQEWSLAVIRGLYTMSKCDVAF